MANREHEVGSTYNEYTNLMARAERPKTVTVTSGRGFGGGTRALCVELVVGADVLSGVGLASGETLHLGAWDVRVLLERPPEKEDEGRPLA